MVTIRGRGFSVCSLTWSSWDHRCDHQKMINAYLLVSLWGTVLRSASTVPYMSMSLRISFPYVSKQTGVISSINVVSSHGFAPYRRFIMQPCVKANVTLTGLIHTYSCNHPLVIVKALSKVIYIFVKHGKYTWELNIKLVNFTGLFRTVLS